MRRCLPALLLTTVAAPALACSDLPNICEANAAAFQQNLDMAYEASVAYGQQMDEEIYGSGDDYGDDYAPFDPMQARLDAAWGVVRQAADRSGDLQALAADPRHARYVEGGWDFFQDHRDARPGEYCAALYWKGDTLVRLSGPGGDYAGAMLTFWSPDIPSPATVQTVPVTLVQSDGGQTVKAFHYRQPNEAMAAIALAVPSLDAALATMEDVLSFELQLEGRTVARIEWKDGLMARERLRACAARR